MSRMRSQLIQNLGANTMKRLYRYILPFSFAFLVACGGKPPVDELDAARSAVADAEESERCAEAEFAAARNLLEQAEAAFEERDYARARQLAEAARVQSDRAREVAEANENCDEDESLTEVVEEVVEANSNEPVELGDYNFDTIYFEFNASQLSEDARSTLDSHAEYLVAHPEYDLTIQGHCDERGSTEYNLALGERRARTVRSYLERLGVDEDRMSVVSYGEEMPESRTNHDRNRRAVFIVR